MLAEKDDLVNLLMCHAGNSSSGVQRSDCPSGHSSQADMQSTVQSSMMQDQPEQLIQEQSASTAAHVSAQCFPSTSETPHGNDCLVNSLYSNTRSFGNNCCFFPLNAASVEMPK
jgi:RecA-family ATPase